MMADNVKAALLRHLGDLQSRPLDVLMKMRDERLRGYGVYSAS
jgi:acetyl-CoA carboxylase alpha subunit